MKAKALILSIFLIILSNCDIRPNIAKAQTAYKLDGYQIGYRELGGMKYAIIVPGGSTVYAGAYVINITKDALELELIKLQIEALKRQK